MKYLVKTDNFFYGGDGNQYNAAWGEVEILPDDFLGIKTNRQSTNWYLKVGTESKHVIIAGCQVNYAVKMDSKPIISVKGWDLPQKMGLKSMKIQTVFT